jgi:hypothetical protein
MYFRRQKLLGAEGVSYWVGFQTFQQAVSTPALNLDDEIYSTDLRIVSGLGNDAPILSLNSDVVVDPTNIQNH